MSDVSFQACGGAQYLEAYFGALANIVENPIGVYNRKCVLNRLKVAVPGEAVMIAWCNYGSYHDLFYKNSKPMSEQDKLDELTGVSNKEWGSNSVPFVCDTIYNVTSDTRDRIDINKVRQNEKSIPQLMGQQHVKFYQYLLTICDNPVAEAWKELSDTEKTKGKDDYIQVLTSTAWIGNKIIAQQQGNWTDPDWELYHHLCKLQILGAKKEEVDTVIETLESGGLEVPESVDKEHWQQYDRWVTAGKAGGNLGWEDFKEARDAMNEVRYIGEICDREIFSGLFLSKGGPGNSYWKKPHEPSCFSADACVRMADGTIKQISDICRGDKILSAHGERTVMIVSMSLRGKRDLFSLKGHRFRFSASHPFVLQDGYGCVSPELLSSFIPTFQQERVLSLSQDTRLRTVAGKETNAGSLECHCFEHGCEEELLYDLIPEPDESGLFQYYVGDEKEQFLVSSEIPSIKGREQMAQVFMTIFHKISPYILDKTAAIREPDFWEYIHPRMLQYTRNVLPARLANHKKECGDADNKERKKPQISLGNNFSLSTYEEIFDDVSGNIRMGILFAAAFAALLPLLMETEILMEEAEVIGGIMEEDMKSGMVL